ncbi:hypothetical protein B0H21DRAFT_409067 [Amylocystis lapponica]|nr:hypothetical protein B0H21DRAFT_409067 [Amylocystis lapponica]
MADRFPAMEELAHFRTTHWEGHSAPSWRRSAKASRLECLRKLSLSCDPYRWMWARVVPVPARTCQSGRRSPARHRPHDDLTTDYLCGPSCGTFLRVADLPRILGLNDARDVIDNLRLSLGPDVDVDAHAEDRNFLIQQWEARHYPLVARMMRHLGERCPTLEEVEWVPTGTWHPSHSVRGLCGCIPYLPNLVGQELVSHEGPAC